MRRTIESASSGLCACDSRGITVFSLRRILAGVPELKLIEPLVGPLKKRHPVLVQVGQARHVFTNTRYHSCEPSIVIGNPADQTDSCSNLKSSHRATILEDKGRYTSRHVYPNARTHSRWHSGGIGVPRTIE